MFSHVSDLFYFVKKKKFSKLTISSSFSLSFSLFFYYLQRSISIIILNGLIFFISKNSSRNFPKITNPLFVNLSNNSYSKKKCVFLSTRDSLFAITSSTTKGPTREETRFHPLVYSNVKSTFGPEKRREKKKKSGKKKIEAKDKKGTQLAIKCPRCGLQSKKLASRNCNCTACQLLH